MSRGKQEQVGLLVMGMMRASKDEPNLGGPFWDQVCGHWEQVWPVSCDLFAQRDLQEQVHGHRQRAFLGSITNLNLVLRFNVVSCSIVELICSESESMDGVRGS